MQYTDKRVLIVEDQRPFLLLLKGLLNSMGATDVVTKPTAEQALSLCKKQKFDIIIADLHLGADKKNGFELIEELKVRALLKPSTLYMIISADSARPIVLGSIERQPDDYIVKPFSQAQLKSRISRAWAKRQFFVEVYTAIARHNWQDAASICESLLQKESPYTGSCEQILVQVYWQLERYQDALSILSKYEHDRPVLWARVALGRTYLKLEEWENARNVANATLQSNRFSAEAHDILAQAQSKLKEPESAIEHIKSAIKISPYSLQRYFTACAIARDNLDFPLAAQSSLSIWELSRHTVHQDVAHWCSYIRSALDAAEHAEEKKEKNRFQQDALLFMQRGRHDEFLTRLNQPFDFDVFESIIHARLNAQEGKMIDAKRHLLESQNAIDNKFDVYPGAMAPDSIKVMFTLGEFEDADAVFSQLDSSDEELDPNTLDLLERERQSVKERKAEYQKFNRQGIQFYQQGKYDEARDAFTVALTYAPVNTGVAINLLQCILKVLEKQKKPEPQLVKECRRLHRLMDNMPLREQHQKRFDEIQEELFTYLG